MPPEQCLKSHWYWANFWIHKQVRVPEYGSHTRDLFRFRLPSTGPGSLVQILVGSIWVGHMVSPKQFFSKLNNLVISFQTMSPKWCLFVAHVPFLSLLPFWALKNLCCLWYVTPLTLIPIQVFPGSRIFLQFWWKKIDI